ncbi:hypothetical protein N566_13560 [Streptomycetaceae bacterium MP113-05]|nr:hypothetical protein N566_13560 [Streptomycetaceae bacterium MP113-05]
MGVRYAGGSLRLRADGVRPASADRGGAYGSAVLPVHDTGRTVHRVGVDLDAKTPRGTRVAVDVRGRDAGGAWTEWREAQAGSPALLPHAATAVQARVTLWGVDGDEAASPVVRDLRLTARSVPAAERAAPQQQQAAAFSATVYATREGLVGGTTANGHVIQPNDHFVALPSRRGLSPNGSGEYSVRVCGPARCETAPVWDVGPWNTHDDYWNPSSQREMWQDLPQGRPEAQAAYQDDYNGGADEFGRQVANPAGIDLADGTFYNVGLNNNGWVTVTYLWTDGGGTGSPQLNFSSYSTLSDGSNGPQVSAAQYLLNEQGFDAGTVDGAFGPNTASAVRAFQQSRGLSADGVVGRHTWAALLSAGSEPVLRQGDSGAAVERLQRSLTAALGRTVSTDGAFGPNTDDAVRDYQSSRGLGVDGIVGNGTWGALQAGR